jgi:hypothetical protein
MATWPVEKVGSSGENVRSIQFLLNAAGSHLTTDGVFGPRTAAAVTAFQAHHGLVADGIVGNMTWPKLIIQVASGANGPAVRGVQSQLAARAGAWIAVDGIFGPQTDGVVRSYQGDLGLVVDGIVGPVTWNALVTGGLGASSGDDAAQAVYDAWTRSDSAAARKNATPSAVATLFARAWSATDSWTFDGCSGAMGHIGCTWSRPGGQLIMMSNNNAGAPFFYVDSVEFMP